MAQGIFQLTSFAERNLVTRMANFLDANVGKYYVVAVVHKVIFYDRIEHGAEDYEQKPPSPQDVNYIFGLDMQPVRTEISRADSARLLLEHGERMFLFDTEEEANRFINILKTDEAFEKGFDWQAKFKQHKRIFAPTKVQYELLRIQNPIATYTSAPK